MVLLQGVRLSGEFEGAWRVWRGVFCRAGAVSWIGWGGVKPCGGAGAAVFVLEHAVEDTPDAGSWVHQHFAMDVEALAELACGLGARPENEARVGVGRQAGMVADGVMDLAHEARFGDDELVGHAAQFAFAGERAVGQRGDDVVEERVEEGFDQSKQGGEP